MDPVSAAIISGLVAGVATDTAKIGKQAAVTAYNTIIIALRKKFGSNSDVVNAVKLLEKKPDSEAYKAVVAEEIKAAKANEDSELITAAKTLQAALEKMPTKNDIRAENIGVVGDGTHIHGGINFGDK